MSTIEDRLSEALAARANLVEPEDLRPASPPTGRVVPLHRRPAPYLLAAAACAAIVSVPILVSGGDGNEAPPAAPTPNGGDVAGADWPEIYSYDGYDVDGDGNGDRVVIRNESGKELAKEPRRMEVQLSSGGTTAVLLDYPSYDLGAMDPVDLDGDGADEIAYYRGTDTEEIGVVRYQDGALLDLEVAVDPGLTNQYDDQGRIRTWWIRDRQLFASRSEEGGFVPGDGGKPMPERYPVWIWTWTMDGHRLEPVSQGQQCVDGLENHRPFPCGENGPGPLPGTQPAAEEVVAVATPFDADVDGDGRDDVVALEGPANKPTVEDGEVLLVVSRAGGGELSVAVPSGSSPEVFTQPYAAADGTRGLLVRQEGGDSTTMTLYLLKGDELVPARAEGGIRLGSGFDGEGDNLMRLDTWLTTEGRLFSRRTPLAEQDKDNWEFSEWALHGTRIVVEEIYGHGCWEC
jgi:hypothetical protein